MAPTDTSTRKRPMTALQERGRIEGRRLDLLKRRNGLRAALAGSQARVEQLEGERKAALRRSAVEGTETPDGAEHTAAVERERLTQSDLAVQIAALRDAERHIADEIRGLYERRRSDFIDEAKAASAVEAECVAKLVSIAGQAKLARSSTKAAWARAWTGLFQVNAATERNMDVLGHHVGRLPVERVTIGTSELDPFEVLGILAKHFQDHTGLPPAVLAQDNGNGLPGTYRDAYTGAVHGVTRAMLAPNSDGETPPSLRQMVPDAYGCARYQRLPDAPSPRPTPSVSTSPAAAIPTPAPTAMTGDDWAVEDVSPSELAAMAAEAQA